MSKHTLRSALALAGLMSASAMVTAPHIASAAPIMNTYSVTCADGSDVTVQTASPPDAFSVCAGHGYNGGKIVVKPAIGSLSSAVRPDLAGPVRADAVSEGSTGASASDAAAAAQAAAVSDEPRGKPGLPTLNCSNSPVNPAALNLSTGTGGWGLTNPGGSAAALNSASNVAWSAVSGGQWVGPGGTSAATGTWTYSRQVRILACPRGNPARLTVSYRADNVGTLRVRDSSNALVTMANQAGTPNYGFLPASLTNHSYTFPVGASGVYTILFEVRNSSGPTGLSANVNLTR
jgi:hypothetical protein